MREHPFFQAIAQKNFRKLWFSQILSQISLNLVNFVIILRIFGFTRSTIAVSLVWIFYSLPAIILGPFSGTVVDLVEKRLVLIFITLIEAILISFYLFAGDNIWPIYTIIFLYSLASQLYVPAEASYLPSTVKRGLLPAANSLFLLTIYASFIIGASLSGPLVRLAGRNLPILLGVMALLGASYSVSRLPKIEKAKKEKIINLQDFFDRAKEGYFFIKNEPLVLFPLILLVLSQVVVSIVAILAPSFALEVLEIDLVDAGLVLIMPAGLGALLGLQIVILALRRGVRKMKILNISLLTSAVGFLSLGLLLPRLPFDKVLMAALITSLLGFSFVSLIIPVQTFIQEMTPVEFRGRVFGVLGFMITLTALLPVLLTATIADLVGVQWIMTFTGILIGLIYLASLGKLPLLPLVKR